MNSERVQRLEMLFKAALEQPPEHRAAFLGSACADDPELHRELASLLNADEEADADGFLEDFAFEVDADLPDNDLVGRSLGPYRLLRLLGQGGMGDVYLAVRSAPFKRYVAVKIIRPGMNTREVLQRFEMERQILAALDHPNIAQLLDGGVSDDGLSYFVMEYVEGVPLTDYCDGQRLTITERLPLFLAVCRAVQYAHQNLVIHRDLKPSNILVTEGSNSPPQVKLLDFGVAKLLNPALTGVDVPVTLTFHRMMTPAYAAPEQVRGDAVTTATDVYALGVILYELLTGHRPYRLANHSPGEIERVICEEEPKRPSTRVEQDETIDRSDGTQLTITAMSVGTARGVTVERLRRRLRGDLDNIVMKALRKETSMRYGSAAQMAADVERYLRGLPVEARASTVGYRMRRFVARHRVPVAAAMLIVLALCSGLVVALWQAREARWERDRAHTEVQKTKEVKDFLLSLFTTADPTTAPGDTLMVRDVLDTGAARIEAALRTQPAVQAEMLEVIGQAYQNLGRYDRALSFFDKALMLRRTVFGDVHEDVARSIQHLAGALELTQELDRAEALYRQDLALQRALHGETHPEVQASLYRLWSLLHMKGQAPDSLFDLIMTMHSELPEMDDPVRARTMSKVAASLTYKRRFTEAEALVQSALAMERRLHGDQHPRVAALLNQQAEMLLGQQRYTDAERVARQALALNQALHPEGHVRVVASLRRLSLALQGQGRTPEAESLYREALAAMQRRTGNQGLLVAAYRIPLARLLYDLGRYDEAEALYRDVVATYERRLGRNQLKTIELREHLADVLRSSGQYDEAERLLLDSYQLLRTHQGEANLYTRFAVRRLIALYEAWDRPEEAARYQALLKP